MNNLLLEKITKIMNFNDKMMIQVETCTQHDENHLNNALNKSTVHIWRLIYKVDLYTSIIEY